MAHHTSTANLILETLSRVEWNRLVRQWLVIPFGTVVILYFIVALDKLFGINLPAGRNEPFPATVAGLLILFFGLLILERILPKTWMERVLAAIKPSTGFLLRTMSLYFTPSFVTLPLSPPISGDVVGKMIAVFVIGYLIQFVVVAWVSRLLQLGLGKIRKSDFYAEKKKEGEATLPIDQIPEADFVLAGRIATPVVTNSDPPVANLASQSMQRGESTDMASNMSSGTLCGEPSANTANDQSEKVEASTGRPARKCWRFSFLSRPQEPKQKDTRPPHERYAQIINDNFAVIEYLIFFFVIGIPVYAATGYTMPIFLALNILMYQAANAIPEKIKKFANPVIMTALFTVIGVWIIALTRHHNIDDGLREYATNYTYLQYFQGIQGLPKPGAGDILNSVLDATIVSLAMPMYEYRRELWYFIIPLIVPTLVLAFPSLFLYPLISYAIGIDAADSLAFAPRSLTLALAQICSSNLGGNLPTVSTVAIMSGIVGVIFGPYLMKLIRIPDDDYITQGVVYGANSSGVATAWLIERDVRMAALSSLALSVFGVLMVVLTSIPPLVVVVRSLVGLE